MGQAHTGAAGLFLACTEGTATGSGLVVAMGALALISSGIIDGLRDRPEPASSSPAGQQRVVSAEVSGRAHVLDGDTIAVGGVRVRLQGLHCPEAGEPGGSTATSAMRDLTRGQYGTCYVGDTDLTAAIIRQGVCARCPRYDPWGWYLPAQLQAGTWQGSMPGYCR